MYSEFGSEKREKCILPKNYYLTKLSTDMILMHVHIVLLFINVFFVPFTHQALSLRVLSLYTAWEHFNKH